MSTVQIRSKVKYCLLDNCLSRKNRTDVSSYESLQCKFNIWGAVVRVVVFDSNNPSSNTAEVFIFSLLISLKRPGMTHFKKIAPKWVLHIKSDVYWAALRSSVDSSAPTIPWSQVPILSTPSTLLPFIVELYYICHCVEKNDENKQKEPHLTK